MWVPREAPGRVGIIMYGTGLSLFFLLSVEVLVQNPLYIHLGEDLATEKTPYRTTDKQRRTPSFACQRRIRSRQG
jgi:hypothetical protein